MSANSTSGAGGSAPSLPNYGPIIGSYAQQFAADVHVAVVGIDGAATLIAFYAAILLIPIGAILYWGHISRHMGKGLLIGGIVLMVLSYTLFPNLPNIAPP